MVLPCSVKHRVELRSVYGMIAVKTKDFEANEKLVLHAGWRNLLLSDGADELAITNLTRALPLCDVQTLQSNSVTYLGDHMYSIEYGKLFKYVDGLKSNRTLLTAFQNIQLEKICSTADCLFALSASGDVCRLQSELSSLTRINSTKMCEISCGFEHLVTLSTDGDVYTYGASSRGQLGNGDINKSEVLTLVSALEGVKIKQISAGGWHTVVLSDIGDVYAWGWNESGEIGVPCSKTSLGDLKPVQLLSTASSTVLYPTLLFEDNTEISFSTVSAGSRHSAALTTDGRLYMWGWNGYDQLGFPSAEIKLLDAPTEISPASIHNHLLTNVTEVSGYVRKVSHDCHMVKSDMTLTNIMCGPWLTIVYVE